MDVQLVFKQNTSVVLLVDGNMKEKTHVCREYLKSKVKSLKYPTKMGAITSFAKRFDYQALQK